MKYIMMFFEPEKEFDVREADNEASADYWGAWTLFGEEIRLSPEYVSGAPLKHPKGARTVLVRDGKQMVHNGPFAETREILGGYCIVDTPDIEGALAWAAKSPAARYGSVEVRELAGSCEPAAAH